MPRSHAEEGPYLTIARIVKPQGRLGEVAAELHTDFPERFAERRRLQLLLPDGERRAADLEEHWFHKGRVILKFRGVDSIEQAETLSGSEVQIERAERATLEAGSAYISELEGCEVFAGERRLGIVAAVQFGAGEAPLLQIAAEGRELLIPFAQAYLQELDLEHKRVRMQLPEGMLELDAPLNAEEKHEQQRPK